VFELRQVLSEKPAGSQGVDCGTKPKSIKPNDKVTLCGRNGTQYALGPDALPPSPVDSATAYQAPDGHWYVLVKFNNATDKDLTAFSRRVYPLEPPVNQAAVVINGVVVNAPAINDLITTDSLVIPGPFTQEDAQALAASITP
jgi:preprotein translocase subunit SecD